MIVLHWSNIFQPGFAICLHNQCSVRHIVNNTATRGWISTHVAINSVETRGRTAPKLASSLKIEHLDGFSTHRNRRFLLSSTYSHYLVGHPALASSGLALNRPIRSRISAKSALDTTTSAIWNTMYRECLITLAPILISFSRSVRSDHVLTDLGNTSRRRKLPRLYAKANNCNRT